MTDNNEKERQNLKKRSTGSAIFTTDMGTGKQGNITSPGASFDTTESGNTGKTLDSNTVQSAGAPGSAGMVGSKRWVAAHSNSLGNGMSDKD